MWLRSVPITNHPFFRGFSIINVERTLPFLREKKSFLIFCHSHLRWQNVNNKIQENGFSVTMHEFITQTSLIGFSAKRECLQWFHRCNGGHCGQSVFAIGWRTSIINRKTFLNGFVFPMRHEIIYNWMKSRVGAVPICSTCSTQIQLRMRGHGCRL